MAITTTNATSRGKKLQGKIAVITGGGSGIGATTAALFIQEGATVLITGLHEAPLQKVADTLDPTGKQAFYAVQDVGSEEQWLRIAAMLQERFGRVDILVNNAGMTGNLLAPMAERSLTEFMQVLSTNLAGTFLGIKTLVPLMPPGSAIVNVSSIAGITGNAGANGYTASKGGSRLFSKGAAIELAKQGIRVNSLHPGYVETPMVTQMEGSDSFRRMAIGSTPMGRGARAAELATGILFLAGEDSSFMTGAELIMDGGFTAF